MDRKEFISIMAILVVVLGIFYPYQADIQFFTFDSPSEITQTGNDHFSFKVHNYGDKSGSYKLEASSEVFLVKTISSLNRGYEHEFSINTHIEDEQDGNWNIYIKANKSDLQPNANVEFSYIDTSSKIFKKDTWNLFYELEESQISPRYNFINKTSTHIEYIVLGNKEIIV